jgi:uncharacterized membrane protein YkvA (DUF1232 family)
LLSVVEDANVAEDTRRELAGSLNYVFKSLDLIPDGIEDLGSVDDAFILRVAAKQVAEAMGAEDPRLASLAADAALIEEFLGADYPRLDKFVATLRGQTVRGRSPEAIASDESVRAEFGREVRSWAESYDVPTFTRDEKTLVKLKAFLSTKLPT